MLVPVIGLVQVGGQARADRYTYLPLIGIFIMLAWGLAAAVSERRFRIIAECLASGMIGACLICTFMQARHWHDSITLWTYTLRVNPQNGVAKITWEQPSKTRATWQVQNGFTRKPCASIRQVGGRTSIWEGCWMKAARANKRPSIFWPPCSWPRTACCRTRAMACFSKDRGNFNKPFKSFKKQFISIRILARPI